MSAATVMDGVTFSHVVTGKAQRSGVVRLTYLTHENAVLDGQCRVSTLQSLMFACDTIGSWYVARGSPDTRVRTFKCSFHHEFGDFHSFAFACVHVGLPQRIWRAKEPFGTYGVRNPQLHRYICLHVWSVIKFLTGTLEFNC